MFAAKETNDVCQPAHAFLDRIETYLLANDLTADDLSPEPNPPS